jgi:hypothetical protein
MQLERRRRPRTQPACGLVGSGSALSRPPWGARAASVARQPKLDTLRRATLCVCDSIVRALVFWFIPIGIGEAIGAIEKLVQMLRMLAAGGSPYAVIQPYHLHWETGPSQWLAARRGLQ